MFDDLLAPGAVLAPHGAANKRAAMAALGVRAAGLMGLEAGCVTDALLARERLGSTGFGGGVAIPHGRVDGLRGIGGVVMRLAQPIDWEAIDGRPVDLVFMLVGPEAGGAAHLKALARVSRALRDPALVAKLRGAPDADSLRALLCSNVAALAA